jgi:hypothetical protein
LEDDAPGKRGADRVLGQFEATTEDTEFEKAVFDRGDLGDLGGYPRNDV